GVVHGARLVVLDVATHRLAVRAGGGRDARVPHPEAAAEGHARHRVAVAALVVDALPELLLRLVDARLHLEVGEAVRPRPAGEATLLEGLLDAQQVLHAGLPDRLLAVVLARVAQIALIGERRRAVQAGAAWRGLVEAAVAHLDGMRGIQRGHELEQLGLLPAREAGGELGRARDRQRRAHRLDAARHGLECAAGREAQGGPVGIGTVEGDLRHDTVPGGL